MISEDDLYGDPPWCPLCRSVALQFQSRLNAPGSKDPRTGVLYNCSCGAEILVVKDPTTPRLEDEELDGPAESDSVIQARIASATVEKLLTLSEKIPKGMVISSLFGHDWLRVYQTEVEDGLKVAGKDIVFMDTLFYKGLVVVETLSSGWVYEGKRFVKLIWVVADVSNRFVKEDIDSPAFHFDIEDTGCFATMRRKEEKARMAVSKACWEHWSQKMDLKSTRFDND